MTQAPSLENHFNFNLYGFSASADSFWANPHLKEDGKTAIIPYIPSEPNKLTNSFQTTSSFSKEFPWPIDIVVTILKNGDLKNVIICSTVCKSFYKATKDQTLWKVQLNQFLPNVTPITKCPFYPSQQFQIINNIIKQHQAPFVFKFNFNKEKCLSLGEKIQGGYLDDVLIRVISGQIAMVGGSNYDGNDATIDPLSEQGQLLHTIKVLVRDTFNSQEKFEEVIRESENALKMTTSNSTVTVKDGGAITVRF